MIYYCHHAAATKTGGNESDYYLSFIDNGGTPSVLIMTTDSQPVTYHIQAPGIRYHRSGTVTADNEAIVSFPSTAEVTSHIDQNKGIYLKTNSSSVTIIGQNKRSRTTDTFLAQPTVKLSVSIYVYYGISVPRTIQHSHPYHSSVLLVGTEDNTIMTLIVTQSVTISVGATTTNLTRGRQYSFVINRLQTVYIESLDDLTGTKIVTDKPISVFSGHECANVPYDTHACDHLVEQIPPTILWGQVYYTAPLAKRRSYTIKILAAHNSTNVTVNCGNMSVESYMINEREFFSKTLQSQEYCAINSDKIILVIQFSHGRGEDGIGDPMMTLVPATSQYDHKFKFSTVHSPYHDHYVNIIVIAQYYQPDIIYLTEGKISRSLKTQHWVPITVNNVTEAYITQVKITEGVVEIVHSNSAALMTTIVYGFSKFDGYGHPGGLNFLKKISGYVKVLAIATAIYVVYVTGFEKTFLPHTQTLNSILLHKMIATLKNYPCTCLYCPGLPLRAFCQSSCNVVIKRMAPLEGTSWRTMTRNCFHCSMNVSLTWGGHSYSKWSVWRFIHLAPYPPFLALLA